MHFTRFLVLNNEHTFFQFAIKYFAIPKENNTFFNSCSISSSSMLIATQIQRLVMLNGKTWVLYFAYPASGLSHCLALG